MTRNGINLMRSIEYYIIEVGQGKVRPFLWLKIKALKLLLVLQKNRYFPCKKYRTDN